MTFGSSWEDKVDTTVTARIMATGSFRSRVADDAPQVTRRASHAGSPTPLECPDVCPHTKKSVMFQETPMRRRLEVAACQEESP